MDAQREAVFIAAGSQRQAMDWSLALASQEIACVIRAPREERGWGLEVDARDATRALRTLQLYHLENRRWTGTVVSGVGDLMFHWGVLLWCLLMLMIFHAGGDGPSRLNDTGRFVTSATRQGEWWRPLTATFLHASPEHLVANLTTGFVLIGLAMGRFGAGPTLLSTLVAGTAANLFAWAWRAEDYTGLGASGVVMAALGMLAVMLARDWRMRRISGGMLIRALLGGILLFILLGTSPRSDVLAHGGGFLAGALCGAFLVLLPDRWTRARRFDVACAAAYLLLGGGAWAIALR